MDDIAIRVENLSKQYRIGRAQQRHDTLRDALVDAWPRLPRPLSRQGTRTAGKGNADNSWQPGTCGSSWQENRIWALKDVTFEVKRGEVVGIIGRNGAGKSTLLKILSRITEPTQGRAEIHGRVGSLLEVGTGFHPELTGRENVYLSGAILGMRRHEIERRFDEIVEFSGIGKLLDTPIKRYSSGMNVRLGFAVAAHLDPEILLVDEVLAVGDVAFQRRCLGRMETISREGRTVLFVSHNLPSIARLCQRAILLKGGRVDTLGPTDETISQYLVEDETDTAAAGKGTRCTHPDLGKAAQIMRVSLADQRLSPRRVFAVDEKIVVSAEFVVRRSMSDILAVLQVRNRLDEVIYVSTEIDWDNHTSSKSRVTCEREPGHYLAELTLPSPLLNSGRYQVVLFLVQPNQQVIDELRSTSFDLVDNGTFASVPFRQGRRGSVVVPIPWSVGMLEEET
jgi:lipopolysaccharide transport system ATP-binding protein